MRDLLQTDAIGGMGVTAQATAENPKRHTPRRRARTNKAEQCPNQPAGKQFSVFNSASPSTFGCPVRVYGWFVSPWSTALQSQAPTFKYLAI